MKLHRFFVDLKLEPYLNQKNGAIEIQDKELAHQIKKVLRYEIGDSIIIFDGAFHEATAQIEKINNEGVEIKIISIEKNKAEPEKQITLYLSILKRENFELAVQKAVEVGISEIVPIICGRTIKTGLNGERIKKIIKEAAEQSGRGKIPALNESLSFEDAVKKAAASGALILFDISGTPFDSNEFKNEKNISIFIGPEGGWAPLELSLAAQAGVHIVKMSDLTMRAETAAIVASYLTAK